MTGAERVEFGILNNMIGEWIGEGEVMGNRSELNQTFQYIIQDRFIQCTAKSITRDESGSVVDDHEDVGIFSFDPDRQKVVLHEFHSEGYVYTYILEEVDQQKSQLVFVSESSEGGGQLRARVRYQVLSDDSYLTTLDLAKPGEAFRQCVMATMKRQR